MTTTFIVYPRSDAEEQFLMTLLGGLRADFLIQRPDAPAVGDRPARVHAFSETVRPYWSCTPAGYDTILCYLARHNPEALALIEDPAEDTKRDGFKLCHMARRADLPVFKVKAPAILRKRGITEVNAYPMRLLRERFGD